MKNYARVSRARWGDANGWLHNCAKLPTRRQYVPVSASGITNAFICLFFNATTINKLNREARLESVISLFGRSFAFVFKVSLFRVFFFLLLKVSGRVETWCHRARIEKPRTATHFTIFGSWAWIIESLKILLWNSSEMSKRTVNRVSWLA